jgi:hypothetical protein
MALLVSSTNSFDLLGPQGGHRVEDLMLYVATKSLMAQSQALRAPTIRFIQAGVLLAVYEYAHGHPEPAFVTIGSYARMAYAAQLRSIPASTRIAPPQTDWTIEEEEIDTWWGIRICERYVLDLLETHEAIGSRRHRTFLCELAIVDQPLCSVVPVQDELLPLEPSMLDQMNPAVALASRVSIQELNSPGVGGFGRSAQAAWLLDGVLQGLSMSDPDQKQAHLTECDRTLQSFLAVVMQQHGGNYGMFCVPIALTIRSVSPQSLILVLKIIELIRGERIVHYFFFIGISSAHAPETPRGPMTQAIVPIRPWIQLLKWSLILPPRTNTSPLAKSIAFLPAVCILIEQR